LEVAEFLSNPNKALDAREASLEKRIGGVVKSVVTNALAVNDFRIQNPDLASHDKIVTAFVPETDPRKSVAQRLTDAGKLAREYLAKVAADGKDPGHKPPVGEHVEGPRGGEPPRRAVPGDENVEEGEKELADYIRERQARLTSHFGGTEQKT